MQEERRWLVNINTWELIILHFKNNILQSIESGLEFERNTYEKQYLEQWSREQLKGNALVEVEADSSPMSMITPGHMLYNKGGNKLRFVKLRLGKDV